MTLIVDHYLGYADCGWRVTVAVKVTDSLAATATKSYAAFVIKAKPSISAPTTLPGGQVGIAYTSTTLTGAGGTTPYTWSLSSGALPAGVTLNASTGVISGTPTASGSFTVTAKVTDSIGGFGTKAYAAFVIKAAPSITLRRHCRMALSGRRTTTMTAAGGTTPYTWSVLSGALPTGVTMTSAGVISGTPTAAGTFSPVIKVTDSLSATATKSYTVTVTAPALRSPPRLRCQAGRSPWRTHRPRSRVPADRRRTPGALPAASGLALSTAGVLTGTPTAAGSYASIVVTVTDNASVIATKSYSVAITGALAITAPASLPDGQVGIPYTSTTITRTGGSSPFVWTATGLPAGVTINSSTGVVSGTPTVTGAFSPTITVTDSYSTTASRTYSSSVTIAARD